MNHQGHLLFHYNCLLTKTTQYGITDYTGWEWLHTSDTELIEKENQLNRPLLYATFVDAVNSAQLNGSLHAHYHKHAQKMLRGQSMMKLIMVMVNECELIVKGIKL